MNYNLEEQKIRNKERLEEDIKLNIKRKCAMCGEYKEEKEFRYMKKQNRYNCYCKNCERLYNKEYQRIYRERKKEVKNGNKYKQRR